MNRCIVRFLFAAGLTACVAHVAPAQAVAPPQAETMQITAQGQFQAVPDTAVVSFDLLGTDTDLRTAYNAVQDMADRLRAILRDQKLSPADAQLGRFSVSRNTTMISGQMQLRDYTVSLTATLELTDFSKVGPLLDAVASADLAVVQSVSYSLRHTDAAKAAAIADGYQRAAAEANALAAAEGRRLLGVAYSSVDVTSPAPYVAVSNDSGTRAAFAFTVASPTDDFGLRTLNVTAKIDAVYRIAQ